MSFALAAIVSDVQKVGTALKYASQINFAQAAQAFETANLAGEIQTIDDVLKIIGVFVPPVAIAANDLGTAVAGFDLLLQFSSGKIPQTTLDLEETIRERFQ
jgi:hypothetical protein